MIPHRIRALAGLLALVLTAAAPSEYLLRQGDQIAVSVYGDQALSQTVTVLPDGSVTLALIGPVSVIGKSADAAAAVISSSLKRYMRHPVVTVSVLSAAQANVLVLGDVKTPGKFALRPGARLTDAVAAAGGFASVNGTFPTARVSMPDGSISAVSLQALIHDGQTAQNLPLAEGAIVYVEGPQTYLIEVVGAVDHPGNIELHEGDRLSMAIAKAGNSVSALSDLSHVFITRTEPGGTSASHEVDMYQALRGGDLLYDPLLRKGDIVYVPQARKSQPALGILSLLRMIIP